MMDKRIPIHDLQWRVVRIGPCRWARRPCNRHPETPIAGAGCAQPALSTSKDLDISIEILALRLSLAAVLQWIAPTLDTPLPWPPQRSTDDPGCLPFSLRRRTRQITLRAQTTNPQWALSGVVGGGPSLCLSDLRHLPVLLPLFHRCLHLLRWRKGRIGHHPCVPRRRARPSRNETPSRRLSVTIHPCIVGAQRLPLRRDPVPQCRLHLDLRLPQRCLQLLTQMSLNPQKQHHPKARSETQSLNAQ